MNLSMKWLQEFVDIQMEPREFSEAMTLSGSKVEGFETEGAEIQKVVVAKVLSIEPHPNADSLVVCQVDVGAGQPIQIVTGASNLKPGDVVPAALDGATLPGGVKIKKGKLRGEESNGMLCSLGELGLSGGDFPFAVEDGIFVLDSECSQTLGQPIQDAIGLNDVKVEFEITSNRPDCFSVIGLAREAAATFDKELHLHSPKVKAGHGSCDGMLQISIEAPDLCSLYSARVVKNVRVKPSPRWMRERLRAMGVRPINNIVDITNYVMLEYGQPMHAFDLRFIEDGTIRVRRAEPGETITTLDGVDRTLTGKNLVIADAKKPIAIAGVMGGEYSGILDDTTTIVLESACFHWASVRTTARDQGMRTDASSRYEKGLDYHNCLPALERACELIEMLDAGDVLDGVLMDDKSVDNHHSLPLEAGWINRFLHLSLSEEEMKAILQKLGCTFDGDTVHVPTYRPDLVSKADIAEEIARFYGYNRIPTTGLTGSAQGKYSPRQKFDAAISQTLLGLGLSEIVTYSFLSPKSYDKIAMPKDCPLRRSVTISNPLGEDTSILRTIALPSMLDTLARNYNGRNEEAALFELACEYRPMEGQELPEEKTAIVGGMYGKGFDFFVLKGIVEELLRALSVPECEWEADPGAYSYHPGRCARITAGGETLGIVGQIHPLVAENYGMACPVYAFSLDAEGLFRHAQPQKTYRPLPKFPAVTRDLALICDESLPVRTLEKAMQRAGGKLLESIQLFDVYQGEQIEAGKKSVAFRLSLRSLEETLTDEQANQVVNKMMRELEKEGAVLRS